MPFNHSRWMGWFKAKLKLPYLDCVPDQLLHGLHSRYYPFYPLLLIALSIWISFLLPISGYTASQLSPTTADTPFVTWGSDQIHPSLAYNPTTSQYLLVWEEEYSDTDHDIYGQLFNKQGAVSGAFFIAYLSNNESNPVAIYNQWSKEYLVVWEHAVSSTNHNIHGMRIDGTGGLVESHIIAADSKDEIYPSLAASPLGYLVAWEYAYSSSDHDIYGQRLNLTGDLDGGLVYFDTGVTNQAYPEAVYYSPSGWNGYLLVWQDQLSGQTTYDIHGRSMSSSGDLPENEFIIFQLEYDQVKPQADCGEHDCLVVWQDHRSSADTDWKIYARHLSVQSDGSFQVDDSPIPVAIDGSQNRFNPLVRRSQWIPRRLGASAEPG